MGTYERGGRGSTLVVLGALLVLAALGTAYIAREHGVALVPVLVAGMGWITYTELCVAHTVTVGRDELRWVTPLGSGSIPYGGLTSMGPVYRTMPGPQLAIRYTGGRPVLVQPTKGIEELVAALAWHRPDLAIRFDVGPWSPFRRWGRSAWREGPTATADHGPVAGLQDEDARRGEHPHRRI